MAKQAKVVVGVPTNSIGGREEMSGIFRYLGERPAWDVRFFDSRTDIVKGELARAAADADGVILSIDCDSEALARKLLADGLKVVVTSDRLARHYVHRANCRVLLLDGFAIGRDAAQHFNSLGRFSAYGFVHGPAPLPWSADREKGFRANAPARTPVHVFPQTYREGDVSPVIPPDALDAFIRALPKPAAVFGANDLFASQVIAACARTGARVPADVAVLGGDNEPLLCENTRPKLSSLRLAFDDLGYAAARTMDRLLRGGRVPARVVRVGGTRLFTRGSTAHIPPAAALVERARAFIAARACEGIGVRDVVAHTGVSRSLLDLRFRQTLGRSVLQEILDRRLAELRRRLKTTTDPVLRLGRECGFNDPDHLMRLFKARTGLTMRQYRRTPAAR